MKYKKLLYTATKRTILGSGGRPTTELIFVWKEKEDDLSVYYNSPYYNKWLRVYDDDEWFQLYIAYPQLFKELSFDEDTQIEFFSDRL